MSGFLIRVLVLFLAGLGIGYKIESWHSAKEIAIIQTAHTTEIANLKQLAVDAEKQFRAKEQAWVTTLSQAQEKRNVEVAGINRKLNAALSGMRKRPERTTADSGSEVPSAPATCAGASGAELAGRDAEFLARYAADAARLNAELNKCEAAYNELRK